jgi:hypothetical protein
MGLWCSVSLLGSALDFNPQNYHYTYWIAVCIIVCIAIIIIIIITFIREFFHGIFFIDFAFVSHVTHFDLRRPLW